MLNLSRKGLYHGLVLAGCCLCPYLTCRMLLMAPLAILGRHPRRPSWFRVVGNNYTRNSLIVDSGSGELG